MATYRQRSGRWQCRVQRGEHSITKTFTDKRDAALWAREVERAIDLGTYERVEANPLATVGDLLARYAREVTPSKKGCNQEAARLHAMGRCPLAQVQLTKLSARHVAEYRDSRAKAVAGGTVLRELALFGGVLNHARKEWGCKVQNFVRDIRLPPPGKGRTRTLSEAEEAALLAAMPANPWVGAAVRLALATAMRRGELLALAWENVNLRECTAHLPDTKNGSSRTVPLSPNALKVLKSSPRHLSGKVLPISANALRLAFERATAKAGIEGLRFHDLRHTAISRMSQLLPNVVELAAVSGHKSLTMLQRYYHVSAEALASKLATGTTN